MELVIGPQKEKMQHQLYTVVSCVIIVVKTHKVFK